MQTVVGRLTADAKINETKDGRKVVNFTIAENSRFKTKGSDTYTEVVNYYNCSYWMGTRIAKILTKGSLIEVCGRLGINIYNNLDGEAKGSLTLHANFIKTHGKPKSANTNNEENSNEQPQAEAVTDDLPF